MELKDKTIIITGASSGIGAAAAGLFAEEGANVVLGARRKAELETLADQITQTGGKAVALAGDVTDEDYSKALVDLAESEFGGLDGAFNNAGIVGDMVSVPKMDNANWHNVIATNLTSAYFNAKYQIPAMEKRGGGSIVFTSSFVGFSNSGMPGMAAYAATKAGVIGMTLSLAGEHGPDGIRVNALLPGSIKTPMSGDDPSTHEFLAGLHPLKRMGEAREIAQSALFLLSDRASFVTGSHVNADGGISSRLV
ncbi:SDR family oxidoreductase [uncultured Roseobacter sp.]|uniref:SDR family oxidoreductase n=1 Tax=uncultured Roseobacter sp. TaxID=114847 RepID=UPI002604552D|nr:SDR family oxidoreductase [uncultured Roseobacter sp.]